MSDLNLIGASLPPLKLTALLQCSREPVVVQALKWMNRTEAGQGSLKILLDRPVRIIFKPMDLTFGKAFADFDALSWMSNPDENSVIQRVIFINEKHRSAPPQALAALLAHEAIHDDVENSIAEETAGWMLEAKVWNELLAQNPPQLAYVSSTLITRLNSLRAALQVGSIGRMVKNNTGYRGLNAHSAGF